MRYDGGVGGEADGKAGGEGAPETRIADGPDLSRALALTLREGIVLSGPINRGIGVQRGHVEHLAIGGFEQGGRLVVQVRSVVHRADSGANGRLDAVGAMRVRRDPGA